jgi:hypothetical protein
MILHYLVPKQDREFRPHALLIFSTKLSKGSIDLGMTDAAWAMQGASYAVCLRWLILPPL